jgi:hypothetical protein
MTIGEHFPTSEILLPSARRRRRAPNWRRRPARLPTSPRVKPGEISQLLAERDFAVSVAAADPTRKNRLAAIAAREALGEARERAATEFGRARNWRLAQRGFMLQDLIAGGNGWRTNPEHAFVDHGASYRCGARPAAFVAQPYAPAFKLDRALEFADEHGLTVHVVEDAESWWFPGRCLVVIWQRAIPPRPSVTQTRGRCWGGR